MRSQPQTQTRRRPDPEAAITQYRQRAPRYDAELYAFEPIRESAIEALGLRPGDTVLDVGCGTGLSFERLHRNIGNGRIIGIEQCPEMIAQAQHRVRERRWRNVDLLLAAASRAPIQGVADAALFHFTHDIVRDESAVANVFAHLKPGARVVAAGLQWAPPWAWPTNAFVMLAALYSTTSLEGLGHPWSRVAARLVDFHVRQTLFGGIYIASGVFQPPH